MKPISDWEIYPDPKQGFRLPLAKGRIVLLDKPCTDLKSYIEWQMEPVYCSLEDALGRNLQGDQPLAAAESPDQKRKGRKRKKDNFGSRACVRQRAGSLCQSARGFLVGRDNPPDSLNCAILLTARMMPFYFEDRRGCC